MIICSRNTTENDRDIWMQALEQASDLDCSLRVRQPVQVDAEQLRTQSRKQLLRSKAPATHHQQREVDDSHSIPMPPQKRGEREKSNWVHLEHRRGWDHIAERTIENRAFTKVVDARRVDEDEVGGLFHARSPRLDESAQIADALLAEDAPRRHGRSMNALADRIRYAFLGMRDLPLRIGEIGWPRIESFASNAVSVAANTMADCAVLQKQLLTARDIDRFCPLRF